MRWKLRRRLGWWRFRWYDRSFVLASSLCRLGRHGWSSAPLCYWCLLRLLLRRLWQSSWATLRSRWRALALLIRRRERFQVATTACAEVRVVCIQTSTVWAAHCSLSRLGRTSKFVCCSISYDIGCSAFRRRLLSLALLYPCFTTASTNWAFDFVFSSSPITCSVISRRGSSAILRRRIAMARSSEGESRRSSWRVLDAGKSTAGKILRSASSRARRISRLPVPLNSS